MIKVSPRVTSKGAEFYRATFPSLNAGCEYVLDSFPVLYHKTMMPLFERFSEREFSLITETFNGTMLTSGLAGQHLAISVADACDLDSLDVKWGVDRDALLEKISTLSQFEATCLEIWARAQGETGEEK